MQKGAATLIVKLPPPFIYPVFAKQYELELYYRINGFAG